MADPDVPDDACIIHWMRSGDDRGPRWLLQRHAGRVLDHLRRRFPSFDEQQRHDVLVDALLVVRDTFDPARGTLGGWLVFLAHQQAINRLRGIRSLGVQVPLDDTALAVVDLPPDARAEQDDQLAGVRSALDQLSPLERRVIDADLEAGMAANARVLARQFGTSERSIYAARTRARRKLSQRLGKILGE
jgi:RNA polymerase sigma factor (sigma-70 family)